MMSASMSDPNANDGGGVDDAGEVLRNLPRTRPQRPSARRTQTAQPTAAAPEGQPTTSAPAAKPAPKPRKRAAAKPAPKARAAASKPAAKAKPKARASTKVGAGAPSGAPQGFEADTSVTLDPPGAADVLDAALGTAGDLVQSGLELGGRAVRGALSRLLGG
jgi:hypothetical protein